MKQDVIDILRKERSLADAELRELLVSDDNELIAKLKCQAQEVAVSVFGHEIKSRGLIEISNYCKNNCKQQIATGLFILFQKFIFHI